MIRELASGGEELLKLVTPGEYFGEIGPVFHLPRSATARARTDATVIGYTVRAFRERLGIGGVRHLIEHRPLVIDGTAESNRPPAVDFHAADGYSGTRLSRRSGPIGSMPSNRQRCAWAMDSTPTSSTALMGPPNRIGAT